MKLIIPMAGRGTRVRPHSHVTPKPLLPVCGKSMVERIVDTFSAVLPRPISEGVFVLGPDFGPDVRRELTAICERHQATAHFVVQDEAKGTAHAVACANEHLNGEGIVVFADTLFFMEPGVDVSGADVVAWVKHVDDPSAYGVAVREGDRVVRLVEKPKELISTEALIGIYYCRDLSMLKDAVQFLFDNNMTGVGGEYQLTDAFDRMLKQNRVFKTATVTEWLDCGNIPALLETTKVILRHERHAPDAARVSSTVIHEPVFLAEGAIVEGGEIGPYVSVEADAVIRNATITNSVVFAGARVESSTLNDSFVGRNAEVQRFSGKLNIGDHSTISG